MKKYKVTKERVSYAIDMLYGVLRIPTIYIIAYLLIAGIFYLAIMERDADLNYFLSLSVTEIFEFNSHIKYLAIIISVIGTIFTFFFPNNKCSGRKGLCIVTIIIGTFLSIFVVGRFSITGGITYYIIVFACIRIMRSSLQMECKESEKSKERSGHEVHNL